MDNDNDLLTAPQVAEILGVNVSWVHRHARQGKLPVVRLGRYQRFRRGSLMDWVEAQERPATKRPTMTKGN